MKTFEVEPERGEFFEPAPYRFEISRRGFVQILGAGLLLTVAGPAALGQFDSRPEGDEDSIAARLHIGENGIITVMTSKVECGQGARTQISQAAAEELRVPLAQVALIMADTAIVPDDGGTFGSRTTPSTIPDVRQAAAAARELLLHLAAQKLGTDRASLRAENGAVLHEVSGRSVAYADLAQVEAFRKAAVRPVEAGITVTPVREWKVLGVSARVGGDELVTGKHRFPSDIQRPGMLYGKVLRAPAYNSKLTSVDLAPAQALEGVVVVKDGDFVGCAAPTSWQAGKALQAVADTAQWETEPDQPSSANLFAYLKSHTHMEGGGRRGPRTDEQGSIADGLKAAKSVVEAAYEVAYIQHVPLEPRAAVAEWEGDRVTVWTGTQRPDGVQEQVAEAFSMPSEKVRVIVPDFGAAFGGKHTNEAAVEAARLAKAAGKPVSVCWTRAEEFTWAYYRPAALIETRAGMDANGRLTAWEFTNYNSGTAGIGCPYEVVNKTMRYLPCDSPLRTGSYRALAATANNFARESFIDECAAAAGIDPVQFRLDHLDEPRLRAVLEKAAEMGDWSNRPREGNVARGIACGTEKASFVAACAEVEVDRAQGTFKVRRIWEAFECGAIQNPQNLLNQVQGCIVMGLGGALSEEAVFENGKVLNASLRDYRVPRFKDVPPLEIHLLDRPDLPSVGAGETPIIAVAPAIANAIFAASGVRIRSMPLRGEALKG
jgi:isoquinoline 1-oxidoreductase beta subunit